MSEEELFLSHVTFSGRYEHKDVRPLVARPLLLLQMPFISIMEPWAIHALAKVEGKN